MDLELVRAKIRRIFPDRAEGDVLCWAEFPNDARSSGEESPERRAQIRDLEREQYERWLAKP